MHPPRVSLLLVFALPLLAGCATPAGGAGEGVGYAKADFGKADPESAPKLIRCPDFRRTPFEHGYRVGLQFVVLADGTVDGSSIAPVNIPRTTLNNPDWAIEEAVSVAIGCRFEPATRDGVAVSASHIRIFRILRRL